MSTKVCPCCGAPVVRKPGPGRPPKWCSAACRRRAYLRARAEQYASDWDGAREALGTMTTADLAAVVAAEACRR